MKIERAIELLQREKESGTKSIVLADVGGVLGLKTYIQNA